jgi:hypothetical protein
MLFDMLTADAASKHGHEFSSRSRSSSASPGPSSAGNNRNGGNTGNNPGQNNQQGQQQQWLLPQGLPFKVVGGLPYPVRSNTRTPPGRIGGNGQRVGSRAGSRTRKSVGGTTVMGDLKEEPEEDSVDKREEIVSRPLPGILFGWNSTPKAQISIDNLKMPGAYQRTPPTPTKESTPVRDLSSIQPLVIPPPLSLMTPTLTQPMMTESPKTMIPPETPTKPVDMDRSIIVESSPATTTNSKREHRPRCRYEFAHPPPATSNKGGASKNLRVLAQMHTRRTSGFHRPVYEVVPVSKFEGIRAENGLKQRIRRLGRSTPKASGLAAEDWAILKVPEHPSLAPISKADDEGNENQPLDSRDVLGIISLPPQTSSVSSDTEIAQIQVETAVWKATLISEGLYDLKSLTEGVPCGRWYVPKAQRNSISNSAEPQPKKANKFYFAPMRADTRKHPTLGCITPTYLDIYDPMPSTEPLSEAETLEGELLRRLVVVSSFWVMAREGWSTHLNVSGVVNQKPSVVVKAETPTISTPKVPTIPEEPTPVRRPRSRTQSFQAPSIKPPGRGIRSISLGRSLSLSSKRKTDENDTSAASIIVEPPKQKVETAASIFAGEINRPRSAEPKRASSSGQPSPAMPSVEQDPTAQFRHILAIDSRSGSMSSSPCPSIKLTTAAPSSVPSRAQSIVEAAIDTAAEKRGRRKSGLPTVTTGSSTSTEGGNVAEVPKEAPRTRPQSVHWSWRIPMPQFPSIPNPVAGYFASQSTPAPELTTAREVNKSEAEVSVKSTSTAVESTVNEPTSHQPTRSISGSPPQSLADTVETAVDKPVSVIAPEPEARTEVPIEQPHAAEEPLKPVETLAITTKAESTIIKLNEPIVTKKSDERVKVHFHEPEQLQQQEQLVGHEPLPSPLAAVASKTPQSQTFNDQDDGGYDSSSDDLELFGVSSTSPDQYWRDFDRLQAQTPIWRTATPQGYRSSRLDPPNRVRSVPPQSVVNTRSSRQTEQQQLSLRRSRFIEDMTVTQQASDQHVHAEDQPQASAAAPRRRLFGSLRRSMSKQRGEKERHVLKRYDHDDEHGLNQQS